MAYRLKLAARAERDIDEFLTRLADYSPQISAHYENDLASAIRDHVLARPHTWPYFFVTGSPYRAYLYSLSRRTSYWLVYTINETEKTVDVLRFWHASRDPDAFIA